MTLSTQLSSALEQTWVSLDLETTGLDNRSHEIIEVGAVKFRGYDVIDTYQALVNPYRRLSEFIVNYTHITQREVDGAPPFAVVAGEVASFVEDLPIIGHNVPFDIGFLEKKGLKLDNPLSDTWDLAYALLPEAPEYALSLLAVSLGIEHPQPHRALPDAAVTHKVFIKLLERALELDVATLTEIQRLANRSKWVLGYVMGGLLEDMHRISGLRAGEAGLLGFNEDELKKRLDSPKALHPNKDEGLVSLEALSQMMDEDGPVSKSIPGYEPRQEQFEMMKAVAQAINNRRHLIVEGGTGVGKSLAYLLPAALYAIKNQKRVVISTNTINLQEQLISKDIPAVIESLKQGSLLGDGFYATQLKGRANYLCMRRWLNMRASENISADEARLLAKTQVWLRNTSSGDRSELNLAGRTGRNWDKISAQLAPECPLPGGVCFLRAARSRAASAHIIVVNHALLLSDLAMGGGLIPDYDTLIIDEAHHLEDEATKHLGFQLSQTYVDDHLQDLSGQRGLFQTMLKVVRASTIGSSRKKSVEEYVRKLEEELPRTREVFVRFYEALQQFMQNHNGQALEGDGVLRMTNSLRKQPGWSRVEIDWENVNLSLQELGKSLQNLQGSFDDLDDSQLTNYQGFMMDLTRQTQVNSEIRERLSEFVPHSREDRIYWLLRARRDGALIMNAAPLNVGDDLSGMLFSKKECVILTGATLSTNGSFDHIRQRVGLSASEELIQGSPFDYKKAALVCVPEDMPEPTSWNYQAALEKAVVDVASSVQGRTLVLFTSHASLQTAASAIRATLASKGVQVLAQGIDGTPKRLAASFLRNPNSVILGTSSFWEGVDLAGGFLKALILVRLPFNVPTDPVFQARSELFDNPFHEYAVPQATLRFRQGFGRLIRGKSDKGVVVVLDRRLTSRNYGKAFLNSLPDCTVRQCGLREMANEISGWVEG